LDFFKLAKICPQHAEINRFEDI